MNPFEKALFYWKRDWTKWDTALLVAWVAIFVCSVAAMVAVAMQQQ